MNGIVGDMRDRRPRLDHFFQVPTGKKTYSRREVPPVVIQVKEPALGRTMDLGVARVEITQTCGTLMFPDEVDLSNGEAILTQAERLLDSGIPALILDLTRCTFFDSNGLNVITRSQMRASELGVPMWVVLPARGIVRRVSDVAGLQRRVAIAPDVATAREAIALAAAHR